MEINEKRKRIIKGCLAALLTLASLAATACLLLVMGIYGGSSGQSATVPSALGVVERFFADSTNAISDAMASVMKIEKHYWISGDASATPVPDKNCYGEAETSAELDWLVEAAADLLEGQTLYFNSETPLLEGTKVKYYLDETILAITWKQPMDGTVYTFSEIKIADPSQLRRYMAGGSYGSGMLVVPTEMAASVNAVVATSGDFYSYRNNGIIVYEGKVCRANGGADTCFIDNEGNMHFKYYWEYMTVEEAQAYVDENNIQFSLAFGPVLVKDGETQLYNTQYPLGEVDGFFARAALCQMDELHYVLVNTNGEGAYPNYTRLDRFLRRIGEMGCQQAYALDGGQTAAIIMDGELINTMTKGYQRKISDIFYFATALPNPQSNNED